MATSRIPKIMLDDVTGIAVSRTPGPLGINDRGDPLYKAGIGDTPGPLGVNDHADPHHALRAKSKEQVPRTAIGKWDPVAAVGFLQDPKNGWAGSKSKGRCARAVRQAINAGHIATPNNPVSAADYKYYLPQLGFVSVSTNGYAPKLGDIAVFPAVRGHSHGHIQMFTGEVWQSDYIQGEKNSNENWAQSFYANRIWISHPYYIFRR